MARRSQSQAPAPRSALRGGKRPVGRSSRRLVRLKVGSVIRPVWREVRREARLTQRLGKLPKGTIVPIGTPGSRSRQVVRYRDRKTGQTISRTKPAAPRMVARHPRRGIFITKTEDRQLRGRAPRSVRSSRSRAGAFLRVSPKARAFLDGLPSDRWRSRLVAHVARALRDGFEPRVAARVGIREIIRERREEEGRGGQLLV